MFSYSEKSVILGILSKIHIHPLFAILRQRSVSGGVNLNIHLVSCIRPPSHVVSCDVLCKVDNHDDCGKEQQLH